MLDLDLVGLLPDLISAIFIIISIILAFIIGTKSYKTYKKNKSVQTKIFIWTSFSLGIAMILLTIEQLFLAVIHNDPLGLFFGGVATIVSGVVVVCIDAFSFSMVFTKKYKALSIISAILMSIPVLFHLFDPDKTVVDEEIYFTWDPFGIGYPLTPLVIQLIIIPLLIVPVLVFFYYAIKIRKTSTVRRNKAIVLALGILSISTAYTLELMGLPDIIKYLRSLFLVGGILIYIAMFKIKEQQ